MDVIIKSARKGWCQMCLISGAWCGFADGNLGL